MTWNGIQRRNEIPDPPHDERIEIGYGDFDLFYFRCKVCGKGSWSATTVKHKESCQKVELPQLTEGE